jgi:hypothetical protein
MHGTSIKFRVSVHCPGPVWTPLSDNIRYLYEGVITAEGRARSFGDIERGQF